MICGDGTVKTISINQRQGPLPKLPKVLVYYNLAEGLTHEEQDPFLSTEENLFVVGTITMSENLSVLLPNKVQLYLADLRKADLDTADLATMTPPTMASVNYPEHFYTFTKGEVQVNETLVQDKLGAMKLAAWNRSEEDQLRKLKVGTENAPKILKISAQLEPTLAHAAKDFLKDYTNIFAWTYKDLNDIPPLVAQH